MHTAKLPIFFTTLIVLSSGCLDETPDSGFWGNTGLSPVPVSDFTLVDQYNKTTNLTDFEGNVLVVAFIFTHCTDTCLPTTHLLKNLSIMLDSDFESNVTFLSISLDPDRDTPEMLSFFTSQNNVSWPHLTGSRDSLKPVWDDFEMWVSNEPSNSDSRHGDTHPDEDYNVIHTQAIFILDKDLIKRSVFLERRDIVWSSEHLLHDIEILLQE